MSPAKWCRAGAPTKPEPAPTAEGKGYATLPRPAGLFWIGLTKGGSHGKRSTHLCYSLCDRVRPLPERYTTLFPKRRSQPSGSVRRATRGCRRHRAAPLTDLVNGFAWPDTPLGAIKTDGGYAFFASDGGIHSRQFWQGRWYGNNNSSWSVETPRMQISRSGSKWLVAHAPDPTFMPGR